MSDSVNHPAHYNVLDIECIDVVEHFNFNVGNAMKYLWRCSYKGAVVEDLRKAQWYIAREIVRVQSETRKGEYMQSVSAPRLPKMPGQVATTAAEEVE